MYPFYLGFFLNITPAALGIYKVLPSSSEDQKLLRAFLVPSPQA